MAEPIETEAPERPPLTAERIRELADEAEAAANAPEPEPQPEPQPEPEHPLSPEAELVAVAYSEYLAAVQTLIGDTAEIVPCEVCGGRGFDPVQVPPDPNAQACPDCNGFGQVLTGSKVPGNTIRNCPTCLGRGFVDQVRPFVPPVVAETPPQQGAALTMPPVPQLAPVR